MALFGLDQLKNFAEGNVASGGFSSAATSFNLVTGHGARFPVPDGTAAISFPVVVWNATDYPNPVDDPNKEMILVGANAADAFSTLTRGYDGTSAQNHNTGGKTYKVTNMAGYNLFAQLAAGLGDYGDDYGAANAYKVNLSVYPSAIKKGCTVCFKALNANTASSTLQVLAMNVSLVTATIKKRNGTNLVADDIKASDLVICVYDGTNWQLQTSQPEVGYGTDSGAVNAPVVNVTELRSQLVTGMKVAFIPTATNTAASTLNFNSTGAKTIKKNGSVDLAPGDLTSGQISEVRYDGTNWQLLSTVFPAVRSEIWMTGGNGEGSTNTMIRRFTTISTNTGTAISITQSATNGDSFTINEPGIYAISYVDEDGTGGVGFGLSKNSNQLTTSIQSITLANCLGSAFLNSANQVSFMGVTCLLAVNDVIRAHGSTASRPNGTTANVVMLRIVKVTP
jgi:hypothetical protein